ncbi:initiation factor 2 [Neobacillus kokaensis]|uniref:Ribose 1,5-bisphosphate isomerase n=1 Tax=Neobacillus kokaensis TaxID=2759023 RepID=A0ABQ3N124_9BACI|nr:initiation factor 2 [Neobacillus kokaensis]GHH98624.1 ribose 1,5-bisphosphate isomerase [Neobacillus kokaensis]
MNVEEVRNLLPESSCQYFDDIRYSRVLGANRHIEMIGDMIASIAIHEDSTAQIIDKTLELAKYFKAVRGSQSRAVYNAINYMINGLDQMRLQEYNQVKSFLIERLNSYFHKAEEDIAKIIEYANNVCEQYDSIMVFDYSSTLNKFILNANKKMNVYIAESRALDGGRPFVEGSLKAEHNTYFFPDSTMFEVLKKCQAAFIGAETFYPNGTVFNTIGSDILAVLCEHLNKPLYALTPMIKVDTRNIQGHTRLSPMPYDFSQKIALHWEEEIKKKVNFDGIKLLEIEPKYLRAIITEKGVIPPYAMFTIALEYAKNLEGDSYV